MNNLQKEIAGNLLNDFQHDRAVINIIDMMMKPLEMFHTQAENKFPRLCACDDILDACLVIINAIAVDPKSNASDRQAAKTLLEQFSKAFKEMAEEVNI